MVSEGAGASAGAGAQTGAALQYHWLVRSSVLVKLCALNLPSNYNFIFTGLNFTLTMYQFLLPLKWYMGLFCPSIGALSRWSPMWYRSLSVFSAFHHALCSGVSRSSALQYADTITTRRESASWRHLGIRIQYCSSAIQVLCSPSRLP